LRRFLKRKCLWPAFLALCLGVVAATVYRASPQLLCVDSGPCQASAIIVLGGGSPSRPLRAAELYRARAAPLVIVSGAGESETDARILRENGVPASAIVLEDQSRSTYQNARNSVELLRARHLTNAIVVTHWFHSRRAMNCFQKIAPDLRFYSRPTYIGMDPALWPYCGVRRNLFFEYPKTLIYWVRYGICPWRKIED